MQIEKWQIYSITSVFAVHLIRKLSDQNGAQSKQSYSYHHPAERDAGSYAVTQRGGQTTT
jgi:hypothetical protein